MAEDEEYSKVKHAPSPSDPPQPSLPFLEVICKSSGKTRRFAVGTEAGFALNLINRKLDGSGVPFAFHIEAVKEGEEPVSFGPNSVLVDYGNGWKLQAAIEVEGLRKGGRIRTTKIRDLPVMGLDGSHSMESPPVISMLYIGKILVAFVLIFVLGAIFTLALENLPRLILYINSSV